MNDELKIKQENISKRIVALAKDMQNAADEFINGFNQGDMLTFSRGQSKSKSDEYLKKYYAFFAKISPMITELSRMNARLASLLIQADKEMKVDIIVTCENRFNAYEKFELELYKYIKSIEDAFENSTASATFIINATQKLKNSLSVLIEKNA